MRTVLITILLLLSFTFSYSQFYIDNKSDTISYFHLPSNARFMEHYVFKSEYKFYYDTIHDFSIKIPDTFDVEKTNDKDFVIFQLPRLLNTRDQIWIKSFSRNKIKSLADLEFNELTKYKPGDTLSGYDMAVLNKISLECKNTYRIDFRWYDGHFVQQWRFFENSIGYYVIVLFTLNKTYDLRTNLFNEFILQNVKGL